MVVIFRRIAIYFFLCIGAAVSVMAQKTLQDINLEQTIRASASPKLRFILDHPEVFQYQLIYTEITRDADDRPAFKHRYLQVNDSVYFNPASMVKFPTALMALEKMEQLSAFGVNPHTLLKTEGHAPASLLELVRKAMIVSDNEAYNRLFEFLGQEYINRRLQEMGYNGSRITRRFLALTPEQHRVTPPVQLLTIDGRVLVDQPAQKSVFPFDFSKKISVGNAHYNWSDSLVRQPMDFTTHNWMPLRDLQQLMQSFLFPSSVPERQRFRLSENSRQLMLDAISSLPAASRFPVFDTTEYFDSYSKFFLYRDGKRPVPSGVRIYNKTGWSYGYLIDVAYIQDFPRKKELMLSGVIYVNQDGILNDNNYEYDSIGYPFFREIGEILLDATPSGRVLPIGSHPTDGAIIRGDRSRKNIALVFTGHSFGEGGKEIATVLKKRGVKASFFLTGDFYRNRRFRSIIRELKAAGNYLGTHGDKHLLYNDWQKKDSLLVTKEAFIKDLRDNEAAMKKAGIDPSEALYFLPSYEWYNDSIVWWTNQLGRHLVNYTPGTLSHADYTRLKDKNYRSSARILESIHQKEAQDKLNGFLLLLHIGTGPGRPDPFWKELDQLISWLQEQGYQLKTVPELLFTGRVPPDR